MNPTNSANIQSVLSQLRQYQAIAEGNNVENLNNKKVDNENGFAESIKNAEIYAQRFGDKFIGLEALFLGIVLGKSEISKKLVNKMTNINQLEELVTAERRGNKIESQSHQEGDNLSLIHI